MLGCCFAYGAAIASLAALWARFRVVAHPEWNATDARLTQLLLPGATMGALLLLGLPIAIAHWHGIDGKIRWIKEGTPAAPELR